MAKQSEQTNGLAGSAARIEAAADLLARVAVRLTHRNAAVQQQDDKSQWNQFQDNQPTETKEENHNEQRAMD